MENMSQSFTIVLFIIASVHGTALRDQLIKGVSQVSPRGTLGQLMLFGQNVEAIITGDTDQDIVLAAATFGSGKILMYVHDGYLGQFLQPPPATPTNESIMVANINNRFTNRDPQLNYKPNILNLDTNTLAQTDASLAKYDYLISYLGNEIVSSSMLSTYLKNGGGLIIGKTTWAFFAYNPTKTVSDIEYSSIFLSAGFLPIDGYASYSGSFISIKPSVGPLSNFYSMSLDYNLLLTLTLDNKRSLVNSLLMIPQAYLTPVLNNLDKHWTVVNQQITQTFTKGQIITTTQDERNLVDMWTLLSQLQTDKQFKAYGIEHFPGVIPNLPVLTSKSVSFTNMFSDYYFTGCYASPGVTIEIQVSALGSTSTRWYVIIGTQTDYLKSVTITRWPSLTTTQTIIGIGKTVITSPYGGNIYFVSPGSTNSITASISNVVLSPRYDLMDLTTQGAAWLKSRKDLGLWADLSGQYVTITMPSSSIRNMDDPSLALKLYDQLVKNYHDLRGTDINLNNKYWVVPDLQPSAGYMHSGYPIVTHMDVTDPTKSNYLLNHTLIYKNGAWGIYHEFGHMMQQKAWTFSGTGEVTVNIFSLYGSSTISNMPTWIHPWLKSDLPYAINYANAGADFNKWSENLGVALFLYAQLANSFTWDAYKGVFRTYQAMPSSSLPETDQDKIDLWFLTFSKQTKTNLAPLAFFWGIPLSTSATNNLKALGYPEFLPEDDVTIGASKRTAVVKSTYPNLVQKLI